jgi:UDP-glucose 4-epimerase
MTRFMMSLDQAVDLVLFAFNNGKSGDLFVQKSPAATIPVLAEALKKLLNKPKHKVKTIGTRHGEKVYEVLMTKEESAKSIDMGDYYRVPADDRDLNYNKFFDEGEKVITEAEEYNSHNTYRLDEEEMRKMLIDLHEIQDDLTEK